MNRMKRREAGEILQNSSLGCIFFSLLIIVFFERLIYHAKFFFSLKQRFASK